MFIESAVKFRNISHKIYKHYQHNIQFCVQYFARDYVMTVQSNYTNFFQVLKFFLFQMKTTKYH